MRIHSVALICFLWTTALPQSKGPEIREAWAAVYPRLALIERIAGDVVIRVNVGKDGLPAKVTATSGNKFLYEETLAAVKKWTFQADGREHKIDVTMSFRLVPVTTPPSELAPIFKPPYQFEIRGVAPLRAIN